MPNWVFNNLKIEGEERVISELRDKLSRPIPPHKGEESVAAPISFWNIICPPEDKWGEYFETHGWGPDGRTGDTSMNWYNFNNREWGTKWDACNPDFSQPNPTTLLYSFDTAWCPPARAFEHLSEQYPQLTISIEWQEEQGFGATLVFTNGEATEVDGYDWLCGECDYRVVDGAVDREYCEDCEDTVCPKCKVMYSGGTCEHLFKEVSA